MKSDKAENQAYDGIISMIMEGKLRPGTRIVEQHVSDELNMSRTPVRNAIRSLASVGLLENRGKGGYIMPPLSLKDLWNLFKLKFMLEPAIVRCAAQNADDAKKDYFLGLLQQEREYYCMGKTDLYKINSLLHSGIASLTNNRYMESLQTRVLWRAELYMLFFNIFYYAATDAPVLRDPNLSESHTVHVELVNAVFEHDPDKAEDAMRRHLSNTWKMLRKNIISTKNSYGRMLISDWEVTLPELP